MDDNQQRVKNRVQNDSSYPADSSLNVNDQNQSTQTGGTFDPSSATFDVNKQPPTTPQPTSTMPSAGREEREVGGGYYQETEPVIIEKKEFKLPKEIKGWVKEEKKEETTLPKAIKDEFGQILLQSALPNKPKIVLPLTKDQTRLALKHKIVESVRWLAEWCLRILKMFPKRTSYKQLT